MGRSYLHTIVSTKGAILVEDALAMANRIWRISSHILIDFLAVLPIPQVVILIFMGSSSLNTMKFLSFLALLQYVPRVLRIYLLCTKLNKTPARETAIWILFKGAFSFFLYVLANHLSSGRRLAGKMLVETTMDVNLLPSTAMVVQSETSHFWMTYAL
ncbi:hypothetical protein ACE6H2_027027 [Prunus campanulata]